MTNGIDVYYDEDGDPYAVIDGESVWLHDHGNGTFSPLDAVDEDDDLEFEGEEPTIDPRLEADLRRSLEQTQARLGRRLTTRELEAGVHAVRDAVANGGSPGEVASAIESAGGKSLADMNHEEHRTFARERATEKYAAANPKPDEVEYDPDTFEGMRTYAKARADGYEPDPDECGDE